MDSALKQIGQVMSGTLRVAKDLNSHYTLRKKDAHAQEVKLKAQVKTLESKTPSCDAAVQTAQTARDMEAETARADSHNAMEGFMVMYFDECGSSA